MSLIVFNVISVLNLVDSESPSRPDVAPLLTRVNSSVSTFHHSFLVSSFSVLGLFGLLSMKVDSLYKEHFHFSSYQQLVGHCIN